MKIAIIQLYDDGRKDYGDLTGGVARQYCEKFGYTYICYRERINPALIPTWNKLIAVRENLARFDWVFWLDADALIVNPTQRIEDIVAPYESGKDMLFSSDDCGLCAGVFFAKNTPWTDRFLESVLLLGELPDCEHLYEQKTIRTLYSLFPSVRERIGLIPPSVIQFPYAEHNSQAFVHHYWAISQRFEQVEIKMRDIIKHGYLKGFR